MGRLVINGEEVYELDEECLKEKEMQKKQEKETEAKGQKKR